jgi:hypothetical protein
MSNFLQAALELAELGNAVFPLLPCGKTPLTKHGFKDATTDPNIITKWWTQWPDANIGLATGHASGCIVLDIDGADGNSSLEALKRELGPLPATCMARTGKGRHLYFCYPDGKEIRCRTNLAPAIDVRADGGYVVAPPSVHPNGAPYEWIGDEIKFAELPEPWVNLLLGDRRNTPDRNREKRQDLTRAALNLESPSPWSEAEEIRLRSVLACIPATERKIWFEVGAALHWLGWAEKGFEIWDSWSQKAPDKYNDRDQRRTWESFDRPYDGPRITVATIFHLANESGWTNAVVSNEHLKIANTAENVRLDPSQLPPGAYKCSQQIITAADLRKMIFTPIQYVVPGFIPEGLTLLVGRPKIGKSWLALDLCLACAGGWSTLGAIKPAFGDVLYLGLEDSKHRLQRRIDKLLSLSEQEWPSRLHLVTSGDWQRADLGGLDDIEHWCRSVPKPVLVVVDTLERIRKPATGKGALYSADYEAISGLQKVAAEHGIAIVVLHHDRKSEADDAFDTVSGTLGLTAAADTILILKRKSGNVVLHARGRDIEESETALQFDKQTCRWTILGSAAEVQRSTERRRIIEALKAVGQPLSTASIMIEAKMENRNAVDLLLGKMVRDGEIERVGRGRYSLPSAAKGNGQIGQKERSDSQNTDFVGKSDNRRMMP